MFMDIILGDFMDIILGVFLKGFDFDIFKRYKQC